MSAKIKALYEKHGDILRYLIIGGLTTLIDILCFALLSGVPGLHYQLAKVITWVAAVAFAFVGNKWIVFRTRETGGAVAGELFRFVAMRVVTLLFSMGFLYLAVEQLGANENLANILANIIVVILNYVLSKLVVFRKAKGAR